MSEERRDERAALTLACEAVVTTRLSQPSLPTVESFLSSRKEAAVSTVQQHMGETPRTTVARVLSEVYIYI